VEVRLNVYTFMQVEKDLKKITESWKSADNCLKRRMRNVC